jgi:rhamnose transport system permease protein
LAITLGACLGAVNGVLVAYGRVPSIIVTLGTLALFRTILVEISGANSVLTNELPQWLVDLPRVNIVSFGDLDVRLLFFLAIVVVILFQWLVNYLPWGRRLYAIGSNPDAARIAGFPAQRIVFTAFVLSGALAGLAGFMFLARFGNITVVAGVGTELQSVAAAVVGGVSINGGIGSPFGAFLGAVLIDILENSLIRWLAISEFWRDALLGLLILLAVATDTVIMNRLRKVWSQHELQVTTAEETPANQQGDKGYAV